MPIQSPLITLKKMNMYSTPKAWHHRKYFHRHTQNWKCKHRYNPKPLFSLKHHWLNFINICTQKFSSFCFQRFWKIIQFLKSDEILWNLMKTVISWDFIRFHKVLDFDLKNVFSFGFFWRKEYFMWITLFCIWLSSFNMSRPSFSSEMLNYFIPIPLQLKYFPNPEVEHLPIQTPSAPPSPIQCHPIPSSHHKHHSMFLKKQNIINIYAN